MVMKRGNRWNVNTASTSRRPRGNSRIVGRNGPSEIYEDLLEEALRQSSPNEERPLKRRKSQRDSSDVIVVDEMSSEERTSIKEKDAVVIESSSSIEESEDEEMEWDNVDLNTGQFSENVTETQISPVIREVTLTQTPTKSEYVPTFFFVMLSVLERNACQ